VADSELEKTIAILGGASVFREKQRAPMPGAADARMTWTGLIRKGIPSKALVSTAKHLRLSINELSQSLGLPERTVHRRVEKGQLLTPEETERSVRAARALAKAQELLGDDNGRAWLLSACRGLGGEIPVTLLDTADGFAAVIDELGRLEYGVIS
jgi:putative toxin-antitoxin system antitoxin component (TIGR02293 family)